MLKAGLRERKERRCLKAAYGPPHTETWPSWQPSIIREKAARLPITLGRVDSPLVPGKAEKAATGQVVPLAAFSFGVSSQLKERIAKARKTAKTAARTVP